MDTIKSNLASVRELIESAAKKCERDPASIELVAVSKTKPAALIREAYLAGQRVFGENYAQELRDKAEELKDLDISWHFIGHLQRNKAKYVAPVAAFVESIDSTELAEVINQRANRVIKCLIEVNIGGEGSKTGIASERVRELATYIMMHPNLDLRGLMVIPPFDTDPEKSRPYFKRLRELFDNLSTTLRPEKPFDTLSMGMSHDFEVAIEEGATLVRIGTAIFGGRS